MDELRIPFHPLVRSWFSERIGVPTEVQRLAWPQIAAQRHVLATAPTGSGKTLAAFLWGLNQLISGEWPGGCVRILYISPLKALNTDIHENLLTPLNELRSVFAQANEPFPQIGVETRSGDTPASVRQRMLRRPPEILITTPESLNLLLSSPRGRFLFEGLKTVILDEIHAVAGSKRGAHLMTAVERLTLLAGEFQRIALSATVHPLEAVARFAGGFQLDWDSGEARYTARPVSVIEAPAAKKLALRIGASRADAQTAWHAIAEAVAERIQHNRSTLVFVNSRRICERITLLVNEREGRTVAYAHHGSLSREVRSVVEKRLKAGDLSAIVATNSLELGIDIGALDEVVLVETPPTVASTVQRVGRAGHRVGEESRGTLLPVHPRDVLAALVMMQAVDERDIEPAQPVEAPLDVLAQVLVSMCSVQPWNPGRLYDFLRCCAAYQALTRRQFDLVLDMLTGRYRDKRLRFLDPLLDFDRIDNVVRGKDAARRRVYLSGGTIPDRGYFTLRREETGARIGELDEEFVWERRVGDTFTLGTQSWQIQKITHSDVHVRPASSSMMAPFWKAERRFRSHHLSLRLAEFLEWADGQTGRDRFAADLAAARGIDEHAAEALAEYLSRQKNATRSSLPHRHHVVIEFVSGRADMSAATQVLIHTLWGSAVNHPYAMALAQAWEEKFGSSIEYYVDDDSVALLCSAPPAADTLLALTPPGGIEPLIRRRLEQTGFFGARFREAAGVALVLPRRSHGQRMPLWLSRLRAKKLLDTVKRFEDFPLVLETWRTCLRDCFEIDALNSRLEELRSGAVAVTEVRTSTPSPFGASLLWQQTNDLMYEDDTPGGGPSRLRQDLIAEVAGASELRPRIPEHVMRRFQEKVQRLYPGYAPTTSADLLDWVKERLLIPEIEWEELLAAVERDSGEKREAILAPLGTKLTRFRFDNSANFHVAALECVPRLLRALGLSMENTSIFPFAHDVVTALEVAARGTVWQEADDDDDPLVPWLGEWLRFYGPIRVGNILDHVPLTDSRLAEVLESLAEADGIVAGYFGAGQDEPEVCDRENLERLLRMLRAEARPGVAPKPLTDLSLFLAAHHGLVEPARGLPGIERAIESLFCHPMPAALLERELLPARVAGYDAALLDQLIQDTGLMWFGCGPERIAFAFPDHLDLCRTAAHGAAPRDPDKARLLEQLFPSAAAGYSFTDLAQNSGLSSTRLTQALWMLVWEGWVTNDTFAALRRGLDTGFRPPELPKGGSPAKRTAFSRWRAALPFVGHWRRLPPPAAPVDALDAEEQDKDRARLLLARHGIAFRELVHQEFPVLRWQRVFRALRLLELSGEVLSGSFFDGIPGPQFVSHAAYRRFEAFPGRDAVYWMCAADPASLCGLDLEELKGVGLPRRLPSNHLVYDGAELAAVSRGNGRNLDFRCPADSPRLSMHLRVLSTLFSRRAAPEACIAVEHINGVRANASPYLEHFRDYFEVVENPRYVGLFRKP